MTYFFGVNLSNACVPTTINSVVARSCQEAYRRDSILANAEASFGRAVASVFGTVGVSTAGSETAGVSTSGMRRYLC